MNTPDVVHTKLPDNQGIAFLFNDITIGELKTRRSSLN